MKCEKVLSFLLAILLIFSVSATALAADTSKIDGSNWMSAIDGNKKITSINIPGTHDSATRNNSFPLISSTQSLSVTEQLCVGVRFFDIRAKKTKEDYISVHGITNNKTSYGIFSKNLTIGNIIDDCKQFLQNNPGETVLFKLKEDSGDAGRDFYKGFYEKYIENDTSSWFIENRIPMLDEVRGKIVLLRHTSFDAEFFNDTNCGINFDSYPYIGEKTVGDFRVSDIVKSAFQKEIDNYDNEEKSDDWYVQMKKPFVFAKMYVEDAYKLGADEKIEAISMFLNADYSDDECCFNICSTNSAAGGIPEKTAIIINEFLMQYNFIAGKKYGVVCMDFITQELSERVYMSNVNVMTNEPNAPITSDSLYASYGFMGRLLKLANDFIVKLSLKFE